MESIDKLQLNHQHAKGSAANAHAARKRVGYYYLFSHLPQHFLAKSGLVAEPEPRVRHSEHLPEPR